MRVGVCLRVLACVSVRAGVRECLDVGADAMPVGSMSRSLCVSFCECICVFVCVCKGMLGRFSGCDV